jgi:signal transduction histidine kinase/streptogramin lyase
MRKIAVVFLVPGLLACCMPTFGQIKLPYVINPGNVRFERITSMDGLSSNFANYGMVDRLGFIWIGTQFGLNRYDGYSFKLFKHIVNDSISLSNDFINGIFEDHEGRLWISTYRGLNLYHPENESFTAFYPDKTDLNSPENNIDRILQDKTGRYWVIANTNLYIFSPAQGQFRKVQGEQGKANTYSGYLADSTGNFWIASSDEGLKKYDPQKEQFVSLLNDPSDPTSIPGNRVNSIVLDKHGNIWIQSYNGNNKSRFISRMSDPVSGSFVHYQHIEGDPKSVMKDPIWMFIDSRGTIWILTFGQGELCRYNEETDDFTTYDLGENTGIGDPVEDKEGKLWLNTYLNYKLGHLICFDPVSLTLEKFENDPVNEYSIQDDWYRNRFFDHDNTQWIVYNNSGLNKQDPRESNIRYFLYEPNVPGSINNEQLMSVYLDEESFFVCTFGGGINKGADDGSGHISFFRFMEKLTHPFVVYKDREGAYWAGSLMDALFLFDPEKGIKQSFLHDTKNPKSFSGGAVWDILEDSRGVFWVVTPLRIDLMNRKTGEFIHMNNDRSDPKSLPSGWLFDVFEDHLGTMWIGSFYDGLYRLKFREDFSLDRLEQIIANEEYDVKIYKHDSGIQGSISSNAVNMTYEDSKGRFWVATDKGLNLLDRDKGTFAVIDERRGLENDIICGILEDDNGHLWISNKKGISELTITECDSADKDCLAGTNLKVSIHNLYDLPIKEFIEKCCFKSPDGRLCFGGNGGVVLFRPEDIIINTNPPPVYITAFYKMNKRVFLDKPINDTREIKLKHREDNIAFDFVALNFTNSQRNQYSYKMENLDEDWIQCGTSRTARYPHIPPGKFIFRVKASNNDGIWNEQGTSIAIRVLPPWYRTWIAYIAYVLVLLLVVSLYIRWRTWWLMKRKQVLEKQVEERTHELHEANTLLEEQKEELLQQKEELQQTLEHLQRTQGQLITSEKMAALGGLVAGVAHEINTPVGIGVTAVTSLLEETKNMAEKYKHEEITRAEFREYLQTTHNTAKLIEKNLERAAGLVQSFKQVSADQSTEQQREFNLKNYLEDVIRSLYPKFKNRNIHIDVQCEEKLMLNSYPGAFAQVITNLVLNSINHGFRNRAEGKILVEAGETNRELTIKYTDDGNGIPTDILPRIFDPFFTTDQAHGTGLGLHIVYNLVTQKLGGSIKCISEKGHGTEFTIIINVTN